jgi:MFS family permease
MPMSSSDGVTHDLGMNRARARAGLLQIAVILAALLPQTDSAMTVLALPKMDDDLGLTAEEQVLVVLVYALVPCGSLILSGALGDRFGHLRVLRIGLLIFGLMALVAGTTSSVVVIIASRAVQAIGAALIGPSSRAAMLALSSVGSRGPIVQRFVQASAGVVLLAPVVGGALITFVSWRAAFLFSVPLVLFALVAARGQVLSDDARRLDAPLPVVSSVLVALTTASVLIGLRRAVAIGWTSAGALAGAGVAAVCGTLLVVNERGSERPLVPVALRRDRVFTIEAGLIAGTTFLISGLGYLLAQFAQDGLALSALETGLVVVPAGLGVAVTAPAAAKLFDQSRRETAIVVGVAFLAAGMLGAALGFSRAEAVIIAVGALAIGCGAGFTRVMVNQETIGSLAAAYRGEGAGVVHTAESIGSSAGISMLTTLAVAFGATDDFTLSAGGALADTALLAAIATGLIGMLSVVALRRSPPSGAAR